MRFTTIWTSGYPLREKLSRTREELWRRTAHRIPRKLAYWSLIDSGVRYMESNEIVPEVTFFTVLERSGKAAKSS